MNKKSLIMAILLIFIVILSASSVSAEDMTDDVQLQEADDIAIDQASDESVLSTTETITAGSSNDDIQNKLNSLSDGDTLNFEAGEYKDICIYVDKNITINGNGAKLIGYDNPSKNTTPEIIWKSTNESGYAIGNLAVLYVVKNTGVTISGLTIVGGANSGSETAGPAYSNALVYAMNANNLTFKNNTLDGSSWGLYLQYCADGTISENTIKNQGVTGILNFGSARTVIENNKIINAKNHGIDVRHGTGPNVQVLNNTVIGSKEGIYLMHSKGHTAANNTLINCTLSSISCYGSSNINLEGNKMQKSRIGVLLGGGYANITIGENTFALDNLPYPPTFVYYVAEAQADYQSAADIMGTFSDSSSYSPAYVAYTEIDAPKDISIDYDTVLKKTGTEWTVAEGTTSENIQKMIDGMADGDTLSFAKNAVYNDISIYIDKNIKILGNNATLVGCVVSNFSQATYLNNVPTKVKANTNESGYAVAYNAVLYVLNTTGAVVSDLNIVGQYPKYDTTKVGAMTNQYKTAGIYADTNKGLTITGCDVTGASWGIFEQYSSDSIISKNTVHDVYTTGIMNFGSPRAIIIENTITDATNHGIDTRHGTGPNVTIAFNTISGAKEGIYLMHSKGHTVYNNTVNNCKISGITAYGSGNEVIFNNTITGSRIGFLLGGGYYNVTIGENKYTLDFLPFPPTFVTYLARADSKYQTADDVIGTYSDYKDEIEPVAPVANTSAELQALIDAANEGDIVDISAFEMFDFNDTNVVINKTITLKADGNTTIYGHGANDAGKGNALIEITASNVTVTGINFVDTHPANNFTYNGTVFGTAVRFMGVTGGLLSNCTFENFNSAAVVQRSTLVVLEDNYVLGGYTTIIANDPTVNVEKGTKAFNIYGQSSQITVRGNTFNGQQLDGISIAQGSGANIVEDNTFIGNTYGIYFGGSSTKNSVIRNNTFIDCGYFEEGDVVWTQLPVISIQKASNDIAIENNTFYVIDDNILIAAEQGNEAHGFPSSLGNINVTGNKVISSDDESAAKNVILFSILCRNGDLNISSPINVVGNVVEDNMKTIAVENIGDVVLEPEAPVAVERINTTITVDAKFTRDATDYSAGERGGFFYATLTDVNGNPLVNKTVYIAVNGPIYNVTTDEQGRAGLQVNLAAANTYTYALSFLGDDQYNAAPLASSKLTVTPKSTSITAAAKTFKASAKTKKVTVTLKTTKNAFDGKTYLKAGKKVTLKLNGKTYTAKTNAKGQATFTIKLTKKGKYTGTVKFAGDKSYKASSKKVKITIK